MIIAPSTFNPEVSQRTRETTAHTAADCAHGAGYDIEHDVITPRRYVSCATLALLLTGCGSHAVQSQHVNPPAPEAISDEPHVVTDLSELSTANTAAMVVPAQSQSPGTSTMPPAADDSTNAAVQKNIGRFLISNLDQARYSEETSEPPGETELLNAKAEQFQEFAYEMLRQTLNAARQIEPEMLKGRKLSGEARPVILTAVLDPIGRLSEIVVEQHSGNAAVDKLVIQACKQGLWSRNPPKAAIGANGSFRLRIVGMITNYSYDRSDKHTYDTHLALALL